MLTPPDLAREVVEAKWLAALDAFPVRIAEEVHLAIRVDLDILDPGPAAMLAADLDLMARDGVGLHRPHAMARIAQGTSMRTRPVTIGPESCRTEVGR